jgi:tRNA(adenine34) deaminase
MPLRRSIFALGLRFGLGLALGAPRGARAQASTGADRRFAELAAEMKRRALGWGDQPYGAVLVLDGKPVGEGPSRVVQRGDPAAHAEREAIRDAQRRLGRARLEGSVLYSTARPCAACEAAAFEAGVARMRHGPDARDAGAPASR